MEILLWLVPAAVATLLAMAVVGWVGRERPAEPSAASERLPGEVVGSPGEGVSPPRPARDAAPVDAATAATAAPDVRRTA